MINIMFLLATLLFALGALIGSGLHTHAVNHQYRRVAQRVRELHELEEALAEQDKILARRNHPRAISQGHSTGESHIAVGR
jgi:type II secretory pathway component PulJ